MACEALGSAVLDPPEQEALGAGCSHNLHGVGHGQGPVRIKAFCSRPRLDGEHGHFPAECCELVDSASRLLGLRDAQRWKSIAHHQQSFQHATPTADSAWFEQQDASIREYVVLSATSSHRSTASINKGSCSTCRGST